MSITKQLGQGRGANGAQPMLVLPPPAWCWGGEERPLPCLERVLRGYGGCRAGQSVSVQRQKVSSFARATSHFTREESHPQPDPSALKNAAELMRHSKLTEQGREP